MQIQEFVDKLIGYEGSNRVTNIYQNETCAYNLKNYLEFLQNTGVDALFVGEAPGYRGCRLTGIPFTDERELMNQDNYFAMGDWIRKDQGQQSEGSAKIIWETLREERLRPLMWNTFPYHPHCKDDDQTNRAPSKEEIIIGREFVEALITMFDIPEDRIFAIGQKAKSQLKRMGYDKVPYIRHPSHGGKLDCKAGIKRINRQRLGD